MIKLKKSLKFLNVMKFRTYIAADRLAEERIARIRNSRSQFLQNEKHILNGRK